VDRIGPVAPGAFEPWRDGRPSERRPAKRRSAAPGASGSAAAVFEPGAGPAPTPARRPVRPADAAAAYAAQARQAVG